MKSQVGLVVHTTFQELHSVVALSETSEADGDLF